ncbi:IclR family transcriptional regulator [Tamaricihabitans halophyticus]|uniref:IclR family transcriptional regulator n=1 Tax=Tamaricihabitans halophyticus TaxID=1262583 RepID=A0A4R2Q556_9PSEU|nr:IclR family transcriptional regulator [Tamaricihabitans halophyticus]TCP43619.1 IclR family transcriptional regulator [Tamaricihabitans halophyticus]
MSAARRDADGPTPPQNPPVSQNPPVPQYPIESVDNALKLLLLFAEQPRIRLTDASSYLGVASSTAHRLLAMLQYRGFVRQDTASRAYEPGGALATVATAVLRQVDARARARPVLERLNLEFDETVHLGRLVGSQVNFLDSIESGRAVRVASRVGRSLPAHCTSTGKAMLSTLSQTELHRLYPEEQLAAVTDKTITSRAALERELATTRKRGYAASKQESEESVASVAVAITSPSGSLYAVNVSMPTTRISAAVRSSVAEALIDAAKEIAELLV